MGEIINLSAGRSLGPAESRLVLGLAEHGRRELTRREAIESYALGEKTADEVLGNLVRKGWLARAGRGRYLLIPPEWGAAPVGESNLLALAAQLDPQGYIAFSTAAAHWGLTTQVRQRVWIATRTHARDRRLNDAEVRFARLPQRVFFAIERVPVYGYAVPMSSRVKTALDCMAWPRRAGGLAEAGAILLRAARHWDWNEAAGLLERYDSLALIQRVGHLCESAGLILPGEVRTRLRARLKPSSRTYLDAARRGAARGYDAAWGVVINTDPADPPSV